MKTLEQKQTLWNNKLAERFNSQVLWLRPHGSLRMTLLVWLHLDWVRTLSLSSSPDSSAFEVSSTPLSRCRNLPFPEVLSWAHSFFFHGSLKKPRLHSDYNTNWHHYAVPCVPMVVCKGGPKIRERQVDFTARNQKRATGPCVWFYCVGRQWGLHLSEGPSPLTWKGKVAQALLKGRWSDVWMLPCGS